MIVIDSMKNNYWHWYNWLSTKANKYADGLSRDDEDALKELETTTVDCSQEAMKYAIEAYESYKKHRKRMPRNKGEKKICNCNKKGGLWRSNCKKQKLYGKWKSQ